MSFVSPPNHRVDFAKLFLINLCHNSLCLKEAGVLKKIFCPLVISPTLVLMHAVATLLALSVSLIIDDRSQML